MVQSSQMFDGKEENDHNWKQTVEQNKYSFNKSVKKYRNRKT